MKKKLSTAWFVLICCCFQASGQATYELDLKTCLQKAIQHSVSVQKSRLDKESVQHQAAEKRHALFPQLNTFIDLSGAPILPTQILDGDRFGQTDAALPVRFGRTWNLQLGLTANQLIFDESIRRSVPAAKLGRELAEHSVQRSEQEAAFQVAQLYFSILKTESLLQNIESNANRLQQMEKSAQLLAENDLATALDAKRLRVASTNLEAQKQQLLDAIAYQKSLLATLCGLDAHWQLQLEEADQPLFIQLPTPVMATEERLLNGAMEMTKTKIFAEKASAFPKLNAYASAGVQAPSGDANFFTQNDRWFGAMVFGLRAQSPIFNASKHKVKQLELEMKKHEADLEQFRAFRAVEIKAKSKALTTVQKKLEVMRQNIQLAEEIANTMRLQYQEGLIALSEVLDAQAALTEAQTNAEQAEVDLRLAELELLNITGNLKTLWQ